MTVVGVLEEISKETHLKHWKRKQKDFPGSPVVKSSPSDAIQKAIHFVKLRFIISRAHCLRKDNYQQGKIEFKKSSVKAEKIKERWHGYRELYKNGLNHLDNHDGVITHLQPNILKWEAKRALEGITMNKASEGDGIPAELLQILKDDALKEVHSVCQQIWKVQQQSREWKS